MAEPYRSWAERRKIVRSIIAETNPEPLHSFQLTDSEAVYYRARSAKAVDKLARESSAFKGAYSLRPKRPFGYVVGMVALIVTGAAVFGLYIYFTTKAEDLKNVYSLLGTLFAVAVAAIGWGVAAWIAHRNMVRQNTTNLLFARFSHAPYGEAMHLFHKEFGFDKDVRVGLDDLKNLRATKVDEKIRTAASVPYLLNYYEFVASGVLRGDLDPTIVRQTVKGFIEFFHDKCEPYIMAMQAIRPTTFEHLRKIRTHYREP